MNIRDEILARLAEKGTLVPVARGRLLHEERSSSASAAPALASASAKAVGESGAAAARSLRAAALTPRNSRPNSMFWEIGKAMPTKSFVAKLKFCASVMQQAKASTIFCLRHSLPFVRHRAICSSKPPWTTRTGA